MFMVNVDNLPVKTIVSVKCDGCEDIQDRRISSVKASRKKRNSHKDYCRRCAAKNSIGKKPQCSKDFWQDNKRISDHSKSIKESDKYKNGIKNRPSVAGRNNPNWGKTASSETRLRMSKSRTGKTGENATAWKGGKLSLNKRVKGALQRKYSWFHRVMERDNCECQHCGANKRLDAHHVIPLSSIVKNLMKNKTLLTEAEKIDWLIIQPEIVDKDLENGITLCRKCHKKIHKNWSSHEPQI